MKMIAAAALSSSDAAPPHFVAAPSGGAAPPGIQKPQLPTCERKKRAVDEDENHSENYKQQQRTGFERQMFSFSFAGATFNGPVKVMTSSSESTSSAMQRSEEDRTDYGIENDDMEESESTRGRGI